MPLLVGPLVLAALVLASCSTAPPFDAKAVAMEWAAYMQRDYVVRPGDRLAILVERGSAALPPGSERHSVLVTPTGTIDLPGLARPLQIGGKSVTEVRAMVLQSFKLAQGTSRVDVQLERAATQSVYVCGEVGSPGAFAYRPGMTMTQAIASAGSFLPTVAHGDIRIARVASDGTQRTFRVDMAAVLDGDQSAFLLLPGDVVYARPSAAAELGTWFDLYVWGIFPW